MFFWTTKDETRCEGFDEMGVLLGGGLALVLGGLVALIFSVSSPWGLGIVFAACVGSRYSIRIGRDGIRLTLYGFWFVPVYRRHALLDADIDVHYDLDDEAPRGLVIRDLYDDPGFDNESAVFGPRFGLTRLFRLQAKLVCALEAMRVVMADVPVPPELRNFWLAPQMGAFDLCPGNPDERGRLSGAGLGGSTVYVGDVAVPPGSTFRFNEDRFLIPAGGLAAPRGGARRADPAARDDGGLGASLVFAPSGRLSSLRGAFDRLRRWRSIWDLGGSAGRALVQRRRRDDGLHAGEGRARGAVESPRAAVLFNAGRATISRPRALDLSAWVVRWSIPEITLRAGESIMLSTTSPRSRPSLHVATWRPTARRCPRGNLSDSAPPGRAHRRRELLQ